MSFHSVPHESDEGVSSAARAEHLMLSSYRCWLAGYALGEVGCWEMAWQTLVHAVGEEDAKVLFGEFHHFLRTLCAVSHRSLAWRPIQCRGVCADEALVLGLVAAVQRRDTSEARALALHLLGPNGMEALPTAGSLARALAARGLVLLSRPTLEAFTERGASCPYGPH